MSDDTELEVPALTTEQLELQQLTNDNGERLEHLRMSGINIDTEKLVLRHIIDVMFPTDEARFELELGFQEKLSAVLTEAEKQVDKINLARSAQQASGLIVPRN